MRMTRLGCLDRCCRILGLLALLLPLALAGCGSRTGIVTGTITYNNQPLGNGRVMFINQKDPTKAAQATIQSDGTYTVANVPAGPATITVETDPIAAASKPPPSPGGVAVTPPPGMDMPKPAGGGPGKYVKIPEKYKTKDQSGLTYDVTSGQQKHDIPLQ